MKQKQAAMVTSTEFKVGQIVKMDVAEHSHVTHPYYVEIIFYNPLALFNDQIRMITSIPGEHECKMVLGSNWEYHKPRMTIIGDKKKFGLLLYNQDLKRK